MNPELILQNKIFTLIDKEPVLSGSELIITVDRDEIRILGTVDRYAKKFIVKRLVKSILTPKKAVDDIKVKIVAKDKSTDTMIISKIVTRLNTNLGLSGEKIVTVVKDGHVTLAGQVSWSYQKELLEESICDIKGIIDIQDLTTVSPAADESLLRNKVTTALRLVTTDEIEVSVFGKKVFLKGYVSSDAEIASITHAVKKEIGDAILCTDLTSFDESNQHSSTG